MWEFLDALEGLGCLLDVVCAVFRGIAAVVLWVTSPFRRPKSPLPGASSKSVQLGGRKRP